MLVRFLPDCSGRITASLDGSLFVRAVVNKINYDYDYEV